MAGKPLKAGKRGGSSIFCACWKPQQRNSDIVLMEQQLMQEEVRKKALSSKVIVHQTVLDGQNGEAWSGGEKENGRGFIVEQKPLGSFYGIEAVIDPTEVKCDQTESECYHIEAQFDSGQALCDQRKSGCDLEEANIGLKKAKSDSRLTECDSREADCDQGKAKCDQTEVICDQKDTECDQTEEKCDQTEAKNPKDAECDQKEDNCDYGEAKCDQAEDKCDQTEVTCKTKEAECDQTEEKCDQTEAKCDQAEAKSDLTVAESNEKNSDEDQREADTDVKGATEHPEEVQTAKKVGDVYVYDAPDGPLTQDYDVPPSYNPASPVIQQGAAPDQFPAETYDNPMNISITGVEDVITGVYDAPKMNSPAVRDDTYDVPRAHLVIKGIDNMSGSNRSSTVSMLSTGSSGLSLSHSPRCSMDPSSQDYDYPPAPKVVTPPFRRTIRDSSCGSMDLCDIYDTPPKARLMGDPQSDGLKLPSKENSYSEISNLCQKEPSYQDISDIPLKSEGKKYTSGQFDAGDYIDDYAIPRSDTSRSSGDSGIVTSKTDSGFDLQVMSATDIYDVPPGQKLLPSKDSLDSKTNSIMEMRETEAEIAFQRLQVSESGAVYDVPPQVSKDFTPAQKQGETDMNSPNNRKPWDEDSPDPQPYEPLKLEVEAALEILARLQQDVHASASRLLSFVGKNWRRRENLHPKLYSIKLCCMSVKTSLQEYLEFGQGALATARYSLPPEKKHIVTEIDALLDPLLDSQTQMNKCLRNLEQIQWQTEKLAFEEDNVDRQQDDLDVAINVAKSIPINARGLTLLIQGNAKQLFRVITSPSTNQIKGFLASQGTTPDAVHTMPRPSSAHHLMQNKQHGGKFTVGSPPTLGPKTGSLEDVVSASKAAKPGPPPLRPKPKMAASAATATMDRSSSMKDRPLPVPPADKKVEGETSVKEPVYSMPKESDYNEIAEKPQLEHYDYVHLTKDSQKESKESLKSEPTADIVGAVCGEENKRFSDSDLLDPPKVKAGGLSPKFRERLEKLQKDSEKPVQIHTDSTNYDLPNSHQASNGGTLHRGQLHENDQLILDFYASQVDTHIEVLLDAIDAFMKCVDYNQPPKVFIAHSKFVILAAHKLVYIGDTISRNLLNEDIRNQLMVRGNQLCDSLKATVVGTKNAALNYPSVSVSQEMVDRVVDVSHAANAMKQLITQASKPNT